MLGEVTFNLIKDGIVGHVNVTITQGGFSKTLGNSGNLGVFPMGIYSPSFEKSRLWASTNMVQKTLVVEDSQFQAIKSYFEHMEGGSTHYGLYFGVNCIDFVQNVYELTEQEGHFADLFSIEELRGPLSGWLMRKERTVVSEEAKGIPIVEASYQDQVTASFGISGGIIILAVLLGSLIYNRVCNYRKSARSRAHERTSEKAKAL